MLPESAEYFRQKGGIIFFNQKPGRRKSRQEPQGGPMSIHQWSSHRFSAVHSLIMKGGDQGQKINIAGIVPNPKRIFMDFETPIKPIPKGTSADTTDPGGG